MTDIPSPLAERPKTAEPAAHMQSARRRRRSDAARQWDRDHPARSFRLDPATVTRMHEIQAWYRKEGYKTSLDQLADDLLNYAADRWDEGHVDVTVTPITPTAERRTRKNDSD